MHLQVESHTAEVPTVAVVKLSPNTSDRILHAVAGMLKMMKSVARMPWEQSKPTHDPIVGYTMEPGSTETSNNSRN